MSSERSRQGFKELTVWHESKNLAVNIYKITGENIFKSDFSLRDQIRRSAVSVPSNIAEGDERSSNKDSIRFFYYAKGSLAELRTQMEIAYEIGYISSEKFKTIENKCIVLGGKIGRLINERKKREYEKD